MRYELVNECLRRANMEGAVQATIEDALDTPSPATTMPHERLCLIAKNMKVGESGWCWAAKVYIDNDGGIWLNPEAQISPEPDGHIAFVERRVNGWFLDVSRYKGRWAIDKDIPNGCIRIQEAKLE